jgi:imidazole glycerol-phosphate synthase subunit HisH
MITILDYGVGNISAIANIYKRLNLPVRVALDMEELLPAERIILPGVGAFDWAMSKLNNSGMRETLNELVLSKRKPVLGICVGMQMMARRSDEGSMAGLGWIEADVRKFDSTSRQLYLPHMGWNDVVPCQEDGLFKNIGTGRFYFLHSYYFAPASIDAVLSTTDYGGHFASSVQVSNIYGVQFHPEKSHQWGIQLLKNFAEA